MKLMMVLGGLIGFGIGMSFSWAQESPWPSSLWRACVSAYASCLLMRWWGRLWLKSLQQALLERQTAALKAAEAQTSSSPAEA